jgi:hypothetical protein
MVTTEKFALVFMILLVSGCAEEAGRERGVEHVDSGMLCIHAEDGTAQLLQGPQEFEPGSRLVVTVQVPECLSNTCDVNRVAECNVVRVGGTLEVTSYLGYDEVDGEPCTMDCGRLTATCESEPLEQGSYRIFFDGASHPFSVPSKLNDPCL